MYQFNKYPDYYYLIRRKPTYQAKTYSAKKLKEKFIERLMPGEPVEVRNMLGSLTQDLFSPTTIVFSKWYSKCWKFSEMPNSSEGKYTSLDISTFLKETFPEQVNLSEIGIWCFCIQVYYASHGIKLIKDDFKYSNITGPSTNEIDDKIFIKRCFSCLINTTLDEADQEIIKELVKEVRRNTNYNLIYIYKHFDWLNNKRVISYEDIRDHFNTPIKIEDFYRTVVCDEDYLK